MTSGVFDERRVLRADFGGGFGVLGFIMDGGETDSAWRRRFGAVEGDVAPFDFAVVSPHEVEFNARLFRVGRSFVNAGHFNPTVVSSFCVARIFGFGGWINADGKILNDAVAVFNVFAGGVGPNDASHHAAARNGDVGRATPD